MKIVKLMGGIGNQMFQYAFAKSIGDDVLFDNTWYADFDNKYRDRLALYALDILNTDINFATKEQIKECLKESALAEKLTNIHKVFHIKLLPTNRVYEKVRNRYEPELYNIQGNVYYDGYFQTPKYFENIKERLIKDFTPKNELTDENKAVLDEIKNTNSVAISTRRGDYVKLGYALDAGYYNKAMKEIAARVENPIFYLFSNDMEWSMKNINTENKFTVIPCESFDKNCGYVCGINLMSHCKHNIITNSTYPWWAAWLNANKDRITVAPKGWIKAKTIVASTFEDLMPDSWIRI
ncbi:MAG: alpha-1,2-fucosyltransferase [bacterium]|nr:alpha-1,2-fucosyltransferase [bacterium]